MPVPSIPLVNGCRHSFASIEVQVNAILYLGVREIQYGDALEVADVRGASPQILGRTRGQLKATASMTMYLSEWEDMKSKLGEGFGEVSFDIQVTFRDEGDNMVTDKIIGCRVTNVQRNQSSGNEPITVQLTLHVMRIEHNGLSMIKGMRK